MLSVTRIGAQTFGAAWSLSPEFRPIGYARTPLTDDEFRALMRTAVEFGDRPRRNTPPDIPTDHSMIIDGIGTDGTGGIEELSDSGAYRL